MNIPAGTRPAILIGASAALLVLVIAGIYVGGVSGRGDQADATEGAGATPPAQAALGSGPGAAPDARMEPGGPSAPEAIPAPTPTPAPPRIDVFQLEPDGTALVAGRGAPGARISLLLDGAEWAGASVDGSGAFAEFGTVPLSDAPRVLSLRMTGPGGSAPVEGETEIIIAPMPQADPAQTQDVAAGLPIASDTASALQAPDATAAGSVMQMGPASAPAPVPDTQHSAPEIATSAAILMSDASGVRVLQPPGGEGQPLLAVSSVALDAISYSSAGDVQLSGRAAPEGTIRVYLDNAPVTTSPISEAGAWSTALPQIEAGIYTLRIDQIGPAGNVTSRVETPFKREDPRFLPDLEASAEASASLTGKSLTGKSVTGTSISAITVQPGNTLWAISRDAYGEGLLYMRVFEANAGRIRDPDLIYPGQVFELPQ